MTISNLIKQVSIKLLIKLLISTKFGRRSVLKYIDNIAYNGLVKANPENRPTRVSEETYIHVLALVYGLDRVLEHGSLSKDVLTRSLDIFIDEVVLKHDQQKKKQTLDFEPPFFLTISPTGKCNLKCIGCYAASDSSVQASLDFKTFDRILNEKRELWGSRFTVISGGEPFLWRDGSFGIMDMFERHQQDYHLMFTNSTLLTEDVARRMADLANITPSISVEGFEKETDARRGKGTYRRILKAMEHLRKHGVPFGISVTPTKHNWDLLTSDEFFEYFFLQEGALYGWMFQYLPIGRGPSLELMVSPEERLEMLKRMQRLVWERKFLLVDFWNSGTATGGCISAGRREGYFYIDWNGNVTPCVFVPYAAANIYKIYEQGGDLNTIMNTPFFKRIREWQRQYGYEQPPEKLDNWLCPCVVRDHFEFLQECAAKYDLTPINEQAAEAIKDPEYCQGMIKYGQEYKKLTDPMWQDIFRGEGGMVYEQMSKSQKKSQAA